MSTRKKLAFSLITLLLFVVLVEVVPRPFIFIGDARIVGANQEQLVLKDYSQGFPRPRPDFRGRLVSGEFDVEIVTNSRGERVSPGGANVAEGDVDLLVVGDSVTFGHGVEFNDTFGWLLARKLEQSVRRDGQPLRVHLTNLGCPGTGLRSQRLRLANHLEQRRSEAPLVVVWTTLLNDGFGGGNDLLDTYNSVRDADGKQEQAEDEEKKRFLTDEARREPQARSALHDFKDWLSRYSVAYEILMRVSGLTVRAYAPKGATEEQAAMLDRAWEVFGQELSAGQQLVQSHGGQLLLGYYPYFHDVTNGDERTLQRLREQLPEGLQLVSLLKTMNENQATYCFPRDGHPSPQGHVLVAEEYTAVARDLTQRALETAAR